MSEESELHTKHLQQKDAAHHLHPFSDNKELSQKGIRIIEKAEGVYLWDSKGQKILDAMAGLWCVNLGYSRKELIAAASRQMEELPYYNSFFQCSTPPTIELAELLAQVTPPNFNHVFFCNSGSEANDTVVRMVRHYWSSKGQPRKNIFISRFNAYHGSTMAAASLGGMKPMHQQGGLPIPGIVHINQPYWFREGRDLDPEAFGIAKARELEIKIHQLGPENVAAFIGEPIQGAGGVIIPPASYWPEINRICKEYDILLVADEVICGFGRTGRWFGSNYFHIAADLMPIAKGLSSGYLPIGGLLVNDSVATVIKNNGGEFNHGYTYSGHPVAAAVAIENIKLLKSEKIIENIANNTGPYLHKRWQELSQHPLVGEARSVGFIGALELVKNKNPIEFFYKPGKVGTICRDICVNNGLVMRATDDTMLISPPLIMTHDHIDELIEKAKLSLDLTLKAIS